MDRARFEAGEKFLATGEIDYAELIFLDIFINDKENLEILNNLGVINFYKGQYSKASLFLSRAVLLNPEYIDAVINYCEVLDKLGVLYQILPVLNKLSIKYPNDKDIIDWKIRAENSVSQAKPKNLSDGLEFENSIDEVLRNEEFIMKLEN